MSMRDLIAKALMRLPIAKIEHGESALPGGRLMQPDAKDVIKDYASRPTPFPPIHVVPPDTPTGKWMIEDGSYRLEAAKLRGDTHIDAYDPKLPLSVADEEEFLRGRK